MSLLSRRDALVMVPLGQSHLRSLPARRLASLPQRDKEIALTGVQSICQ